jgi:hypothetical protein
LAGSYPRTDTFPEDRDRNPSQISTVVVFQAPLGPSMAKTWPSGTSKLIPRTASTVP